MPMFYFLFLAKITFLLEGQHYGDAGVLCGHQPVSPTILFLTQLPAEGLVKAVETGLTDWAPIPMWETGMVLPWPSLGHCGQLGSKPARKRSLCPTPFLSPSFSDFQISKRKYFFSPQLFSYFFHENSTPSFIILFSVLVTCGQQWSENIKWKLPEIHSF